MSRKLIWFAALWLGGVLATFGMSMLMRTVLPH
jgi:hypothetical protein